MKQLRLLYDVCFTVFSQADEWQHTNRTFYSDSDVLAVLPLYELFVSSRTQCYGCRREKMWMFHFAPIRTLQPVIRHNVNGSSSFFSQGSASSREGGCAALILFFSEMLFVDLVHLFFCSPLGVDFPPGSSVERAG